MKKFFNDWVGPIVFGLGVLLFGYVAHKLSVVKEQDRISMQRQIADVTRVAQNAQRDAISREAAPRRPLPSPSTHDQSWVRAMDAWYRDAGVDAPRGGSRLDWHEDRLRALEEICGPSEEKTP